MKKIFLVGFFLAMAVFSSLAFGQGISGENVFDMVQINAPVGLPISMAKGISDDAKVAMLSFQFPSKAQLLVGTASNMVAVATYGVGHGWLVLQQPHHKLYVISTFFNSFLNAIKSVISKNINS